MSDTTQTALIYERLRSGILNLDIAPGERVTERGLEAELSASRTPVRAALMRLEAEGLVQRDGRGWMVTPIDLAESVALLEFREVIESAAVRLACDRATASEIDELDARLRAFDPHSTGEQVLRSGTDFHVELVRLSQNPFLVNAIEGAITRLARTRWLEVQSPDSRQLSVTEHRAVLDAVATRDPDLAIARVLSHIDRTRSRLHASLGAEPGRQALRARGVAVV